jgi:hypothetical protein
VASQCLVHLWNQIEGAGQKAGRVLFRRATNATSDNFADNWVLSCSGSIPVSDVILKTLS